MLIIKGFVVFGMGVKCGVEGVEIGKRGSGACIKKPPHPEKAGGASLILARIYYYCSGKLKLDTEGVFFGQKMYNGWTA